MSTAAAARRSRSRSRSPNSVASTIIEEDNVGQTVTIVEMGLLQTPQIAPGLREDRHPLALDERGGSGSCCECNPSGNGGTSEAGCTTNGESTGGS